MQKKHDANTERSRLFRQNERIVLLEDLPKGTVLRLVSGTARIGIVRPDRRIAWFEDDPEQGVICLTTRLASA